MMLGLRWFAHCGSNRGRLLGDKKRGPFKLEVEWIKFVRAK